MNLALILGAVALGLLAIAEVALRRIWGLGRPPLYVADGRSGYRLAPHQSLRRFGRRIEVNGYSMRGGPVTPEPAAGTLRLLLLGDSIANGGWWTDQPEIPSRRLEAALAPPPSPWQQVEVLNASANSWGPRNQLGYVIRFGSFGARAVVLLLNTDDLFAIAPTSIPVGRDRGYPKTSPPLAWLELAARLRKPRPIPAYQALLKAPGDRVGGNLEAIRQLAHHCHQRSCALLVAMTPLRRELPPEAPRDYELKARQRLSTFLERADIPYLDFLPVFAQQPDIDALYRDHIHLSPPGYDLITEHLAQQVRTHLLQPPAPLPEPDPAADPWL